MSSKSKCPECAGDSVYRHRYSDAGSNIGPSLLPGLGSPLAFATFTILVCEDCGLARYYADRTARANLSTADGWKLTR